MELLFLRLLIILILFLIIHKIIEIFRLLVVKKSYGAANSKLDSIALSFLVMSFLVSMIYLVKLEFLGG
jgi:hypothetical protein